MMEQKKNASVKIKTICLEEMKNPRGLNTLQKYIHYTSLFPAICHFSKQKLEGWPLDICHTQVSSGDQFRYQIQLSGTSRLHQGPVIRWLEARQSLSLLELFLQDGIHLWETCSGVEGALEPGGRDQLQNLQGPVQHENAGPSVKKIIIKFRMLTAEH